MNKTENASQPVTRPLAATAQISKADYWATLDALTKAREIEAAKSAEGETAVAEWWVHAEPRWRALLATLEQAEREDWVRAAVWFDLWKDARARGVAPGSIDTHAPAPGSAAAASTARSRATAPATRPIENAGSV